MGTDPERTEYKPEQTVTDMRPVHSSYALTIASGRASILAW